MFLTYLWKPFIPASKSEVWIKNIGLSSWIYSKLAIKIPYTIGIYLFKVNNRDDRILCKICSKFIKDTILCQLWTDFTHCSYVSIVDFEQVAAGWGATPIELISPMCLFLTFSRFLAAGSVTKCPLKTKKDKFIRIMEKGSTSQITEDKH